MARLFTKALYSPPSTERIYLGGWRRSVTAGFAILFSNLLPTSGFQAMAQSINSAASAIPSCLAWPPLGSRYPADTAAARIQPGDNFSYILHNNSADLSSGIGDLPAYSLSDFQKVGSSSDGVNRVKVLPNGTVFIPKAGFIYVAGLTIPQLEAALRQAFKKIYNQPLLTISGYQVDAIYTRITGQVLIPGTHSLPLIQSIGTSSEAIGQNLIGQSIGRSQNNQRAFTLAALIVKSGGILNTADMSRIEINRSDGSCFLVNLSSDPQTWLSNDIILKNGDTIHVNKASQVNPESKVFQEAARGDLASVKQRIYVLGEVNKPGLVNGSWTTTPLEAIAMAGGLQEVADGSALLATRDPDTNRYKLQKISLKPEAVGNLIIPDESIIVVGRSITKSLLRAIETGIAPAALGLGASFFVR